MSADAVVVGSGPNGLVAAILLAQAGREVLLLEAADQFGGGLRSAELTLPGRVHDMGATVMAMALASPVFRELGISGSGGLRERTPTEPGPTESGPTKPSSNAPGLGAVEFVHPAVVAAHPLDDRPAVLVHRDARRTAAGLGRDAAVWQATVGAAARAGLPLVELMLKPLGPWEPRPRVFAQAARFGVAAALPATTLARRAFRTVEGRAVLAGMAAHRCSTCGRP